MSWNGTVRCRHCYGKGHNTRTCPDKTDSYKRRAEGEIAQGEERGFWHQEYAKRTGKWLDGTAATEMKKKRAGGTRRCKYCNKTGHNTRTCPELKEAKATYLADCLRVRGVVNRRLQEIGLGVGALVTIEHYGSPCLYMVEGVSWEEITHETLRSNPGRCIQLRKLTTANNNGWHNNYVGLPNLEIHGEVEQDRWSEYAIVGPVPTVPAPQSFLDCEGIDLKDLFAGRQSPDWYENRYSDNDTV